MALIEPLPEYQLETLAKFLGECGTGSQINMLLDQQGIQDRSGESTKWKRLYWVFREMQRRDQAANCILTFIVSLLAPERYVGRSDDFERVRTELNQHLLFRGVEFGRDGQLLPVKAAQTLDEAEHRAKAIRAKFRGRRLHPEVERYCRAELMQDNYFHAVFEATKGLAQRIRDMSGMDGDGATLVQRVFLEKPPVLALNTLQTETERSEHRGFAHLLIGCFGAVRNPLAHEPKLLWQGKDDAADYLTLVSLLHRRLDECVTTRPTPPNHHAGRKVSL